MFDRIGKCAGKLSLFLNIYNLIALILWSPCQQLVNHCLEHLCFIEWWYRKVSCLQSKKFWNEYINLKSFQKNNFFCNIQGC